MTNQLATISSFMRSDDTRLRFSDILGEHNVGAYISSVLLAVANSEALQECEPRSIYQSALRAASLRLSVDPGTKQAYLVPFGSKATLIVGYKGLYDMAMRTNKYRYINVGPIYEGETIIEDRISGALSLGGDRTGDKVIGWIGAFGMVNGYNKEIYMTIEEIHAHAKKHSKTYGNSNSAWKTNTAKMESKTVLRSLLQNWGYLDPTDAQILDEIEGDNGQPDIIEGETNPPTPEPTVTVSTTPGAAQDNAHKFGGSDAIMEQLGF